MAYTTIDKPSEHFSAITYTGNAGTQSITGVGFQPDFIWNKHRASAYSHILTDGVRGATKSIYSNQNVAEITATNRITSFDSDGFSIGNGGGSINDNNQSIVSWNWKGANGTASNTNGDVTTTVSANQKAGFSIVSYTVSGGSAYNTGHGLSEAPELVLWKSRDRIASWSAYAKGIGNAKKLVLDTDGAEANTGGWNSTTPTNTLFSHGGYYDSDKIIYYAFHSVKGYSKISQYTGNGDNGNGTFIYTGFKPAMVMIKRSDAQGNWVVFDSIRSPFNTADNAVSWDMSDREYTSSDGVVGIDMLSNGFKCKDNHTTRNASGGVYQYLAIAENPFVTSTGIPATGR